MKNNVGAIDRLIRTLVGITLIVLAFVGVIGWWGWLGLLPLATALTGWCPPYSLLGINTCGLRDRGPG